MPSLSFRLLDIAAAVAPITLNTPVTGQLNPGNCAAFYTFDAVAGQRAFFQATSTDNTALRWRLLDPYTREVVGYSGWNDWEGILNYIGKYTLLAEGYNSIAAPINYQFALFAPAVSTPPLTVVPPV